MGEMWTAFGMAGEFAGDRSPACHPFRCSSFSDAVMGIRDERVFKKSFFDGLFVSGVRFFLEFVERVLLLRRNYG